MIVRRRGKRRRARKCPPQADFHGPVGGGSDGAGGGSAAAGFSGAAGGSGTTRGVGSGFGSGLTSGRASGFGSGFGSGGAAGRSISRRGETGAGSRSEEHTSELQSPCILVCR